MQMQLRAKILSLSMTLLALAGCSAGSDLSDIKTSAGQMDTNTKKIDTDLNKFSASTKEETASQKQGLTQAQNEAKDLKAEIADLKTSTDAIANSLDKTAAETERSAVNSSSGVVQAVAAVKTELQNVGKQLQTATTAAGSGAASAELVQQKAFESHKNREEQFDVFKKAQGLQNSVKEAQVYICLFDFQNLDVKMAQQLGLDLASVKAANIADFLGDMQSIFPENTSDLNITSMPDTALFKFNILAYAMSLTCPSLQKSSSQTAQPTIQSILREVLTAEKNHPSASASSADLFKAPFLPYAYQVAHNAQAFLALRMVRKASGNSEDPHWWQLLLTWKPDLSKASAADTQHIQNQMQSAISFEKDLQDLFNATPQFDSSIQRWIETMQNPSQKPSDDSSISKQIYDLIAITYHHGNPDAAGVWP